MTCFHVEYSSKMNSIVGIPPRLTDQSQVTAYMGFATTDSEKNENIYFNLEVLVALLTSLHCL